MRRISSSLIPSVIVPNASQPDPLHRQLYEKLREQILLGRFAPGQQMPSTRVLAADFDLSRNTILHAFEQLKAEGYLEGTIGSGTYVASALPEQMIRASRSAPSKKTVRFADRRWSRFGAQITRSEAMITRPALFRPFQPGFPALDAFPFDLWTKLFNRYRKTGAGALLGYNKAEGYEPLRKAIASYLTVARGVRCEPEQVMVVSGTQQGLDLTARLLLDPGDSVGLEEPGYRGAQAAFEAASVNMVPLPVDTDGLNLSSGLAGGAKIRLVYTTPSHQFPLGTTMSLPRRLELVNWAAESGAWILEDDYDSEFRYTSRPLPALQGLDRSGSVIYLGTFSKVLFPSLRLGYLVVPPDLAEGFRRAKSITDYHCPVIEQAVLAEFMNEGHFGRHIRRMRTLYLDRLEILLAAVREEMESTVDIRRPDTGMHVAMQLASHVDDAAIARAAASLGVSSMPLSSCYLGPSKSSGLLLGYAGYKPQQIRWGIRKLWTVLSKLPGHKALKRPLPERPATSKSL